jgi:hypothetical protein
MIVAPARDFALVSARRMNLIDATTPAATYDVLLRHASTLAHLHPLQTPNLVVEQPEPETGHDRPERPVQFPIDDSERVEGTSAEVGRDVGRDDVVGEIDEVLRGPRRRGRRRRARIRGFAIRASIVFVA